MNSTLPFSSEMFRNFPSMGNLESCFPHQKVSYAATNAISKSFQGSLHKKPLGLARVGLAKYRPILNIISRGGIFGCHTNNCFSPYGESLSSLLSRRRVAGGHMGCYQICTHKKVAAKRETNCCHKCQNHGRFFRPEKANIVNHFWGIYLCTWKVSTKILENESIIKEWSCLLHQRHLFLYT